MKTMRKDRAVPAIVKWRPGVCSECAVEKHCLTKQITGYIGGGCISCGRMNGVTNQTAVICKLWCLKTMWNWLQFTNLGRTFLFSNWPRPSWLQMMYGRLGFWCVFCYVFVFLTLIETNSNAEKNVLPRFFFFLHFLTFCFGQFQT